VGRRRHFGEGAERQVAGALDDDAGGPRPGGVEGQAVLGQRGGRPELLAPLQGPAAPVPEVDETLPLSGVHEPVDVTDRFVEVAELDQSLVVAVVDHTGGQG
jgi:hypothetical protein